jgi:uncharacterized protein
VSAFLLDVNVLIALIDPLHTQHEAAHRWFAGTGQQAWASCSPSRPSLARRMNCGVSHALDRLKIH